MSAHHQRWRAVTLNEMARENTVVKARNVTYQGAPCPPPPSSVPEAAVAACPGIRIKF